MRPKKREFSLLGGRLMFSREMGSKRGSLPPKEGVRDLTCMHRILLSYTIYVGHSCDSQMYYSNIRYTIVHYNLYLVMPYTLLWEHWLNCTNILYRYGSYTQLHVFNMNPWNCFLNILYAHTGAFNRVRRDSMKGHYHIHLGIRSTNTH